MGRIPDARRFASTFLFTGGAAAALLLTALAGCTSKDPGGGNVVVDDTRPEPRPTATPSPADASGEDAATADAPYDAHAEGGTTTACDECACTPDAHFCFGGNYQLQPEAPADAGLPVCTEVTGLAPEAGGGILLPALGCNAIPAACVATPTCECILGALQPLTSCYLVCAHPGAQIRVACPNP